MSTEPPPFGSGQSPDDDPFRKQQPPPQGGGSPYDPPPQQPPYGGQPPPYGGPYDGGPYGGDPYGGGPYPNDPLSGMPPLADGWKRVLARIIDMILVTIVVGLLAWAFRISQYTVDSDDFEFGKSFAQEALAAVLYIAYDTYFSVRNGQTLGKRLLKLRVANLNDGSTPSVQTALIRAAVLWIPFAFCCACIWTAIAGGWSFFDKPYKQGLHDKAAKTVVVSTA
ncbi:RDD family protein [Streptomyces caniscabiei]|uniref:RDD family protein n=1 Tax=Streptomyces caniscabiei TaxID=2746961 RepID=A0A927QJR0_9ACTN|nr:RDD family protein [Streptomyces caniscabiei]MBD9702219.1 RDD family protein [Streptomyces caniscabiei]MBD9728771.1 RDD family protein [Streptomyces caniscabiei]MDX3514084.1 RDD family protein [Streptomyces caniscabiei]MDX3723320.1 RDD family protein [Streptomyces caniscabiei]MDX3730343.1 RDD family protein [Streptomyces caniscabiei]